MKVGEQGSLFDCFEEVASPLGSPSIDEAFAAISASGDVDGAALRRAKYLHNLLSQNQGHCEAVGGMDSLADDLRCARIQLNTLKNTAMKR